MIKLLAGENAYYRIKKDGFNVSDIEMIMGASGGPKWLMLSQLDRFITSQWLPKMEQAVSLVGTSIGAWRMAIYASKTPYETLERFLDVYLQQRYKEKMTPSEISQYIKQGFLETVVEIDLDTPNRNLNVIAARCKGPFSIKHNSAQATAVFASAFTNAFSGKTLDWFYERVTFAQHIHWSPYQELNLKNNRFSQLTKDNLDDALMASGAIPLIMDTVADIAEAPKGVYIDGGMVDYHFNHPFGSGNGIILYPHFSPVLKPGWFDKGLAWRTINPNYYSNILLICPSGEFVNALPYSKIPDRKDFQKMSDDQREKYWATVIAETERLSDQLNELWQNNRLEENIIPLTRHSLRSA